MSGLEPLAALGLAGNIFQFVEAAAKLCAMVAQIRKRSLDDLLKQHFEPAEIARKMGMCVQALRLNKFPTCKSRDEMRLNDIANECIDISEELDKFLQLIESRWVAVSQETRKPVQIAKELRLAAQLMRTRSRVRDLAKRLQDHKKLLTDAVVTCIPEKLDKMHRDLGDTAGDTHGFYSSILSAIHSKDRRLDEKIGELQEYVKKLVERRFKDDVTVALSLDTLSQDSSVHPRDETFSSGKPSDFLYTLIAIARNISPSTIEDGILESLRFKLIQDRQKSVKQAYKDTFEWVLNSEIQDQPNRPDNQLPGWLLDGTGIFWIPGKAGCGKSTLMKFLLCHDQLVSSLGDWAGNDELLISSYFFWAAGSSLQKNQEGLLRSLLHSILSRRKDLIPKLFPLRYNAGMNKPETLFSCCQPNCAAVFDRAQEMSWHLEKRHNIESEREQMKLTSLCETDFTLSELYDVFLRLSQTLTQGLKIVLMVDGLDEYEGDQSDLVDLFKQLTSGSAVKAIVSSRPEPLFVDALRSCPSLRMDLLTRHDMEFYVKSNLESNLHMQRLLSRKPGTLQELSSAVAKQSSGVFLWTALVVKLLRGMLEAGCFLHELWKAVYAYPVELSALFRHMLLRTREDYKGEGFRIFTLARIAEETEGCFPSLLRFWFFLSELPGSSVQAGSELPDRATFQDQLDMAADRIQSRCCGLLECDPHPVTGEHYDDYDEGLVKPFHRTISDFLREPEIIKMMKENSGDFQPNSRLLESILWCLKRRWMWRTTSREHWDALKKHLELAMVYLDLSEDQTPAPAAYLQSLNMAMSKFWGPKRDAKSRKAFADYQKPWFQLLNKADVRMLHDLEPQQSTLWIALSYGLSGVVKVTMNVDRVQWDAGWGHISTLMICLAIYKDVDCPMDPEIVGLIVDLAEKSKSEGQNLWERPAWEIVLLMRPLGPALGILPQYCQQMTTACASRTRAFERWAHLVRAMVIAGATFQHRLLLLGQHSSKGHVKGIPAWQIVEDGITAYCKSRIQSHSVFGANRLLSCANIPATESTEAPSPVDQLQRLLSSALTDGDNPPSGCSSCSELSKGGHPRRKKKGKTHNNAKTMDQTPSGEPLSPSSQSTLQFKPRKISSSEKWQDKAQTAGLDPQNRVTCSKCDTIRHLALEMDFGARSIFEAIESLGSESSAQALVNWILERQGVTDDARSYKREQVAESLPTKRPTAVSSWSEVAKSRVDHGKPQSTVPGAVWVETTKKEPKRRTKKDAPGNQMPARSEGIVISSSRRLKWTVEEGPGLTVDQEQLLSDILGG